MSIKILFGKFENFIKRVYKIVRFAIASFEREGGARGAAGMAYYTLFSLFPMLIVMVTIGSYFVDGNEASSKAAQIVASVIPVSHDLVVQNISRIMILRNSFGIMGLIGLIWSGSNAFSMMVHHINGAWPESERRSFFEKRLLGLAMVIILILFLFILMLSSTALNALVKYQESIPGLELIFTSKIWSLGAKTLYWVVPFLFFYSLYRIIPMGRIPIKAAGLSAIGITIAWRLASNLFQWYLRSGLVRYEIIFGSLRAIAVLMFWIYISSLILFFGAHLCASAINQSSGSPG